MIRTLFGKLLVALLGFGAAMIAIFAVIVQSSHENYHLELDQLAARGLAGRIVAQGVGGAADADSASTLNSDLERAAALNAGADIYVLDAQGNVLAMSIDPTHLKRDRVDMAPLRRFLHGGTATPILGADPSDPSRDDVFSIAPFSAGAQEGNYLYVLLHRREHQAGAGLIKASYLLGEGAWLVAAGTLLAILSSIAIGGLLTRRLRRLTADIEEFRKSEFTTPPREDSDAKDRPKDEVGRLDAAFAEMAALIVRQMDALNQTDRMRRELMASISHELRAPLTSIQSHLEALSIKDDLLSVDDRHECLEIVTRKARRMAKLISKLFDLAKLDARQMPFMPEAFVLPDLVHDVMQKHSPLAADKGVFLRTDFSENLPLAFADIGLLERAIDNLVENALHHTPKSGTVCVRLRGGKRSIAVEISDTGVGIAAERLATIFDRFEQDARRTSGPGNGVGLGLLVVKSILELHGVEVHVVSTVGVGTAFQFEIPARSLVVPARTALDNALTERIESPAS